MKPYKGSQPTPMGYCGRLATLLSREPVYTEKVDSANQIARQ